LGKLRAGISHQKPEKRHRRTQLRILHLNFKIAQTNGSSALHPIDCLFKEVRQNWEGFYQVRPFDSVVKVKDIDEAVLPKYGHDFYLLLKSSEVEDLRNKIKERKQELAGDALRSAAAVHTANRAPVHHHHHHHHRRRRRRRRRRRQCHHHQNYHHYHHHHHEFLKDLLVQLLSNDQSDKTLDAWKARKQWSCRSPLLFRIKN
jgi:hypothetical protein